MMKARSRHQQWILPFGVGLIGAVVSCIAYWLAERAEDHRIRDVLELRSEWRARDLEAKLHAASSSVHSIATALSADVALDAERFAKLSVRARDEGDYVNALQWAPRVPRDQVAAFEQRARAQGIADYRLYDVGGDFRRTELAERAEYFPVLFDTRSDDARRVLGLALGRHDGRRIPMELARDQGRPVASLPLRPIGAQSHQLVYLLFWPVYDDIAVPTTPEERRQRLEGYAVGNFNVVDVLTAALRDTPDILSTIRFAVTAGYGSGYGNGNGGGSGNGATVRIPPQTVATYSPVSRSVLPGLSAADLDAPTAMLIERDFTVFGQHWHLAFHFSPAVVADLRSSGAWSWLLVGFLLTASLVFYLVRERGRREEIMALAAQRATELQQANEQLVQAQKMEAIGNLTGGMAHDFNNLLAVVIGNLDLLQDHIKHDPEAAGFADAAMQAGLRGAELTRQLLAFAPRQTLEPRLTDVNELVGSTTRLLKRILAENVEITLTTEPDLWPAMIDPAQLSTALANLATNARDAMPDGGRLTIETRNAHLDADYAARHPEVAPGDFVLLQVSDTGSGMDADTLARVFEPFFTTKPVGQGTGLGLSMVFGFVKQSRGHIKIYSEVGEGTVVRLYLPRAQTAGAAVSAAAQPAPARRGHETILVVEDNAEVRRTVVRQLADLGYTILEADGAKDALRLLQSSEARIDLLFTDLVMPGKMNGHQLARAALAERPGLKVLFTSGYPGNALREADRMPEGAHFLGKPYRKQDLAEKLREVLDS